MNLTTDTRKNIVELKQLSTYIPKLSDQVARLQEDTGLSRRAIVVLLADAAGISKTTAGRILDSFSKMEKLYVGKGEDSE